jgi:hypothetical protein
MIHFEGKFILILILFVRLVAERGGTHRPAAPDPPGAGALAFAIAVRRGDGRKAARHSLAERAKGQICD